MRNFAPVVGHRGLIDLDKELVAGAEGADRYIVNQPLSALFSANQKPLHHCRILPVVEALNAYRSSSALVLGSGSAGVALLRSCSDLSHLLPDIVIFDLSSRAWFSPDRPVSVEVVPALLPNHIAVEPHVDATSTGRFLVLLRKGLPDLIINPYEMEEVPQCLATGRVYAAEGRWIAAPNRLAWTGHAPGITLLTERPGKSNRIIIGLVSSSKSGINYFINGRRVRVDQNKCQLGQSWIATIPIKPGLAQDELVELTIAPVRLSTTARPERLEITSLSFQDS